HRDRKEGPDKGAQDYVGEIAGTKDALIVRPANEVIFLAKRGVGEAEDDRVDQRIGDDDQDVDQGGGQQGQCEEGCASRAGHWPVSYLPLPSAASKRCQIGVMSTTEWVRMASSMLSARSPASSASVTETGKGAPSTMCLRMSSAICSSAP